MPGKVWDKITFPFPNFKMKNEAGWLENHDLWMQDSYFAKLVGSINIPGPTNERHFNNSCQCVTL